MKKMRLCLFCLLLTLTVLPATAAQLLGDSTSGISGELSLYEIRSPRGDATWLLTDGSMDSCLLLSNQVTSQLVLDIELQAREVSAIWIRNGDYRSATLYDSCYAPRDVAVTISYDNGNNEATHVYRLSDAYNTEQTWGDWYRGYQRLALPKTYANVDGITLTVRNYYSFNRTTGSSSVAISDIVVAGTSASSVVPDNDWDSGYDVDVGEGYVIRVLATLNSRMATRTGPCTNYTEPGSFFQEGYKVDVITQAYDDYNEIWWVQTEFRYQGELMRAYTGVKRIDADLRNVPVERFLYQVRVNQTVMPWYGPGYEYRKHKYNVPYGTYCDVYNYENGWVQIEYYDSSRAQYRRVWVPESMTDRN